MNRVQDGSLATYNSLTDPNLIGFFGNTRMRRQIRRAGLVNRRWEIISENQYRLNMARKEHKRHVKNLMAQAIVHKTLDLERSRQVEIKCKLEEIAKTEIVRRVKADTNKSRHQNALLMPLLTAQPPTKPKDIHRSVVPRNTPQTLIDMERPEMKDNLRPASITQNMACMVRKGNEELLPYLTPRAHSRAQSERQFDNSSSYQCPKSCSSSPLGRKRCGSNEKMIYIDDEGRPVSPPPASLDRHPIHGGSSPQSSKKRSGHPAISPTPENKHSLTESVNDVQGIDKHLYALDSEALQQFQMQQSHCKRGRDCTISPYLIPLSLYSPRWVMPRSVHSPRRSVRTMSDKSETSNKMQSRFRGGLLLHRKEPPMMHQGEVQTLCEITMKYHGPNLTLPRDQYDPTQEVNIDQQHCGGNTLPVFKERLKPGSTFSFVSRRHRGFPFSLTLYIDGCMDCRVSTCCEYKHVVGMKLGGKMGHFSLKGITGATPCYKCRLTAQAPPRSLKLTKSVIKKKKKKEPAIQEVTADDTPCTLKIEKKKSEEVKVSDDKSNKDKYEDDFEDEETQEKKYDNDFESDEDEKSDKRYNKMVKKKANEIHDNGKAEHVDVTEQEKVVEEKSVPHHQKSERYTTVDGDVGTTCHASVEVNIDIPKQTEGKTRTRSLSVSSTSSSSSSSSDDVKSASKKSPEQQKTLPSTKLQDVPLQSENSTAPLLDCSDHRTSTISSQSLTTELDGTQDTPRETENVRAGRKRSSASDSSSTSSKVISNSDDEKYQRNQKEDKLKQVDKTKMNKDNDVNQIKNEHKVADKFEDSKKNEIKEEFNELDRKNRLELEQQRSKALQEENRKQFDTHKLQSEERLQKLEEERKRNEIEYRKKGSGEDRRQKFEERYKQPEEKEKIKHEHEKQLPLIQSQRDSDMLRSATSSASDEAKPKSETVFKGETEHSTPEHLQLDVDIEDKDKKPLNQSVMKLAIVETNVTPVSDKTSGITLSTNEKNSDRSSNSDSDAGHDKTDSDTKQDKTKAAITQEPETINESNKKSARRPSNSSTISNSSGGKDMAHQDNKAHQTAAEIDTSGHKSSVTGKVVVKEDVLLAASKLLSPLFSDSDINSGHDNQNQKADIKTDKNLEVVSQKPIMKPDSVTDMGQNNAPIKPHTLHSTSSSSEDSSSDSDDEDQPRKTPSSIMETPRRTPSPPTMEAPRRTPSPLIMEASRMLSPPIMEAPRTLSPPTMEVPRTLPPPIIEEQGKAEMTNKTHEFLNEEKSSTSGSSSESEDMREAPNVTETSPPAIKDIRVAPQCSETSLVAMKVPDSAGTNSKLSSNKSEEPKTEQKFEFLDVGGLHREEPQEKVEISQPASLPQADKDGEDEVDSSDSSDSSDSEDDTKEHEKDTDHD